MKTSPQDALQALAALHKAPVADPIVAGTASHAGNAGNAGTVGIKKFTIRLDEELLGRVRAAYLRELATGDGHSSLSAWAASALAQAVEQSEAKFNHGNEYQPVDSDIVPKGPLQ